MMDHRIDAVVEEAFSARVHKLTMCHHEQQVVPKVAQQRVEQCMMFYFVVHFRISFRQFCHSHQLPH